MIMEQHVVLATLEVAELRVMAKQMMRVPQSLIGKLWERLQLERKAEPGVSQQAIPSTDAPVFPPRVYVPSGRLTGVHGARLSARACERMRIYPYMRGPSGFLGSLKGWMFRFRCSQMLAADTWEDATTHVPLNARRRRVDVGKMSHEPLRFDSGAFGTLRSFVL